MTTDAIISDCGRYRYTLTRVWNASSSRVCWIGLNPSTADASKDDPTIRRMIGFARDWGYGGIVVVNLFAFRATDPKDLRKAAVSHDIVGDENDSHIISSAEQSELVLAAWGNHGKLLARNQSVLDELEAHGFVVHHLRLSADGHPCHPLYLPAALQPAVLDRQKGVQP